MLATTPHSYLISITVLSEGPDYRGVMGAAIGLALLARVRERAGLPTSPENVSARLHRVT